MRAQHPNCVSLGWRKGFQPEGIFFTADCVFDGMAWLAVQCKIVERTCNVPVREG